MANLFLLAIDRGDVHEISMSPHHCSKAVFWACRNDASAIINIWFHAVYSVGMLSSSQSSSNSKRSYSVSPKTKWLVTSRTLATRSSPATSVPSLSISHKSERTLAFEKCPKTSKKPLSATKLQNLNQKQPLAPLSLEYTSLKCNELGQAPEGQAWLTEQTDPQGAETQFNAGWQSQKGHRHGTTLALYHSATALPATTRQAILTLEEEHGAADLSRAVDGH